MAITNLERGIAVSISREEVDHVAKLACLELSDEEKERFTHQLSDVIEYINYLREVDTSKVSPTFHVFSESTPLREDKARQTFNQEKALSNAPEKEEGFFRVPPVLE